MQGLLTLLLSFWNWLKSQGPAIGMLLYNYKEAQRIRAEKDKRKAEYELQIEKNHEKIDSDNAGVSDTDGVNKIAGGRD